MRLRNTTEAPISFLVRMNPTEKVTMAEVELDDDIFEKMLATKTTAQVYEDVWEPIEGVKDPKAQTKRLVKMPTGKTKVISLVGERIKCGDLVVTEKPKSKITLVEMVAKLKEMKINVTKESHTEEDVIALYEKLFG